MVVSGLLSNLFRMIIIKVQGGLGNQLLQYSFGRLLTVLYKKEVAYDLSFFENETKYTKRPYLLDKFATVVRVASREEIEKTKYPYGLFSKAIDFIWRGLNKYFIKKYYVGYTQGLLPMLEKKDNYYIEGFWQSYKYYEKVLETLSEEISLQDTTHLESVTKKINLDSLASVAVHVRRGDYLTAGDSVEVLRIDYYKDAVTHVKRYIENPKFYLFSDDIDWVKKEMGHLFDNAYYVSSEGFSECEEFILIKTCSHAIIANSTFSWFSSLLTNKNTKIVVYPKDWKNSYLQGDSNICPPTWHRV